MPSRARRPKASESAPRTWDSLVFQGGGALGAYEAGAFDVLAEKGNSFDVVAGVSIGAANAAIVASRGKEAATFLGRFWDELSDPMADSPSPDETLRRHLAAMKSMYAGNPAMFQPRWVSSPWSLANVLDWTSLYDPAPYRRLLEKHVDFRALREGTTRLVVTAVDVQSGELAAFDSHRTPIGVEHVLASGALPPAFPSVNIDGRHYWDGGLVSGTPARKLLDILPHGDLRRIVMVELFPRHHRLPKNLGEVLSVLKDLTYMRKLDLDTEEATRDSEFSLVIHELLAGLPPKVREELCRMPEYASSLLRHRHHVDLYLLSHGQENGDLDSKDYDFSTTSLRHRRAEGRRAAAEAFARWEKGKEWTPFRAHPEQAGALRSGGYVPAAGGTAATGPGPARATAR